MVPFGLRLARQTMRQIHHQKRPSPSWHDQGLLNYDSLNDMCWHIKTW